MTEESLEGLFEALQNPSNAEAFGIVGAGLSTSSVGMPSWYALLEEMRSHLEVFEASGIERRTHASALEQPQHFQPVTAEQGRLVELERECSELRIENQLLQTRVAEERRNASREVQRYDQLLKEHSKLQSQNGELLNCLCGRIQAADTTASLLLKQQNAQLRMIERYEGVVEHIHGDSVTVAFEIDDDVVEHKYNRSQFIDGQLPEEGDRFTVYAHVIHGSVQIEDDETVETGESDEHEEYQRRKITGPIEF